jgi:fucose 4-O-acetylase-like acetyltransferase
VPGEQYVRHGYVELFYPPVTGILVFMIGLVILAFCLLDCAGDVVPEGLLQVMGECSLALYVLHILIIALIIEPMGLQLAVAPYLGVYLALLVLLIAIAFLLRHLRSCWKNQPYLVRFLIGG